MKRCSTSEVRHRSQEHAKGYVGRDPLLQDALLRDIAFKILDLQKVMLSLSFCFFHICHAMIFYNLIAFSSKDFRPIFKIDVYLLNFPKFIYFVRRSKLIYY